MQKNPDKNFDKVVSKSRSKWLKKARFRRDNGWLRYSSKIAARVLAALEESKFLTQVSLADFLKISPQQIHKIVKGEQNLTLKTIYNLSKALNTELITFPDFKDSEVIDVELDNATNSFNENELLWSGTNYKVYSSTYEFVKGIQEIQNENKSSQDVSHNKGNVVLSNTDTLTVETSKYGNAIG